MIKLITVPFPSSLSARIVPLNTSIISLAIARPIPLPLFSRLRALSTR